VGTVDADEPGLGDTDDRSLAGSIIQVCTQPRPSTAIEPYEAVNDQDVRPARKASQHFQQARQLALVELAGLVGLNLPDGRRIAGSGLAVRPRVDQQARRTGAFCPVVDVKHRDHGALADTVVPLAVAVRIGDIERFDNTERIILLFYR